MDFLDTLDELIVGLGGRVYLAKDGRLSAEAFAKMYPNLEEWLSVRKSYDPEMIFSSNMGKRLKLGCNEYE